ncbi:MAG: response regulator transcription factor [Eubacteriales bacterium]|nr:response regulator transcription factor [Eubacteriales bacterium]
MILILEDDREIGESLKEILVNKGYEAVTVTDVADFYRTWDSKNNTVLKREVETECSEVELFILDVKLPDGSGFDVCKYIRKSNNTPVIFLTSYDDEESVVKGLDIGGDDYITKPFKTAELLSRIAANIRRSKFNVGSSYSKGDLEIHFDQYKVVKNGKELNISTKEFEIIKLLIENKGKVVRRESIFQRIWDEQGNFVEYNTLTVAISRIKAKLGTYTEGQKQYIETIRNVGYRWLD